MYGAIFSTNGFIQNYPIFLTSEHEVALRTIYLKKAQNIDHSMLDIYCDALENDIKNPFSIFRTVLLNKDKLEYTFKDLIFKNISHVTSLIKIYSSDNIKIEYYYFIYRFKKKINGG